MIDAVRQFGVTDIQMPMTPQRVWQALQGHTQLPGNTEGSQA